MKSFGWLAHLLIIAISKSFLACDRRVPDSPYFESHQQLATCAFWTFPNEK